VARKPNEIDDLGLGTLLRQENSVDVGEDAACSNGDTTQKFIQLLVIFDSQGNVARDDARLFIISRSVASQFQDFGAQVF
jgi:hypothetical protein